jgi:hypothetical protein
MLRLPVVVLLSALTMMAQSHPSKSAAAPKAPAAQKPAAPSPKPAPSPAAQVTANEPVITLHGLCAKVTDGLAQAPASKEAANGCTSTISKAAFEKLLEALPISQSLAPPQRRRLAEQYVELLTIAQAGIQAGEEKNPKLPELERFQRMQNLAQLYIRSLEDKYRTPPQAEIDAYYNQHKDKFEQVTLERLYIPRNNPTDRNATPEQKSAWESKAKQLSSGLKERATKGEDMTALQKEAYTKLGLTMAAPNVNVGSVRRGALPAEIDKSIFALNAGGIYESVEPTAFVLYKAVNKQTLGEDALKAEISRAIFQEKMDARKKEVSASVKAQYNDAYFGPATPTPPAGMPPGAVERPRAVKPPSAAKPATPAKPAGATKGK